MSKTSARALAAVIDNVAPKSIDVLTFKDPDNVWHVEVTSDVNEELHVDIECIASGYYDVDDVDAFLGRTPMQCVKQMHRSGYFSL